ncbi:acyltransferase family protein [Pseudomonas segetis]|uniref:Peptidoglycan/LPS O-acetylase OafA/YrhL, contains acyltransferase and SGNH-hydrolase domains n=1 Tax=Pseudomonas segetis TaxID=298908 RepID=A0A239F7X8_9PSED|nr:acyltransferase [Pseudomonas segetis]SNS53029.1 Peptidoglycan/LPS O-acetylase OafA/YrhL, contains acyltransferase and SGNH-hydrolase domains [Pseudomonas segetis]
MNAATQKIAEIEVLRGLAVLGVLFHHVSGNLVSSNLEWLEALMSQLQLWWGVDLFFVISGFVIARQLLPALQQSAARPVIVAFWIRRAFRLLPSAWLWLLLPLPLVLVFNQTGVFGALSTNMEATVAGLFNFANFRFADSFFKYDYGFSFVYWSLSLEEQFYLLLPLLALCFRQKLLWLLLIVVLVQFFQVRSVLMMSLRTDALALGVLLAIWSAKPSYQMFEPRFLKALPLSGGLILASLLLAMSFLAAHNDFLPTVRIGLIAVMATVLVWLASYGRGYLWPTGLGQRLMKWLGARSYAIYLIHIPAYFFTRELLYRALGVTDVSASLHVLLSLTIAAGLISVLSQLNYRWVEMPMRQLGSRVAQRFEHKDQGARGLQPMPALLNTPINTIGEQA